MTAPPTVEHRLIVRHATRPALLLVGDGDRLRLPAFTSGDRHTADVEYINQAARERYGLLTTVLRSLRHSDPYAAHVVRVHELSAHGEVAPPPDQARWYERDAAARGIGGDDAEVLAEWLAAEPPVLDGRDWTRPGWLAGVRAWIEQALAEAGAGDVGEIVQLRSWMSSCVLRVHAARGVFYLKAVAESIARECAVTAYLARRCPGAVAPVVAVERERRWLLTRAVAGRSLEEIDDVAPWLAAAALYGRVQRACTDHVGELPDLGCPLRRLEALVPGLERLCADVAALQPGGPAALSLAEIDRLHAAVPEIARRCERLAASGPAPTLDHGDLWPSNVLVEQATCAIIDWEDAAIAHPFIGLAPLLVGLAEFQPRLAAPAATERLERAYLEALLPGTPPGAAGEALRLARPLGFIDMAIRYRSQRASAVRLHPWMRDLVPQTLRLALAQLEGGGAGPARPVL